MLNDGGGLPITLPCSWATEAQIARLVTDDVATTFIWSQVQYLATARCHGLDLFGSARLGKGVIASTRFMPTA